MTDVAKVREALEALWSMVVPEEPKVGDKVRITGHGGHISVRLVTFIGDIETVSSVTPDGFVGVRGDTVFVHSRLCDPVRENERRGAPRLWKSGDLAHRHDIYTVTIVDLKANGTPCNYRDPHDGGYRYEFIERRKQDLGKEARKS